MRHLRITTKGHRHGHVAIVDDAPPAAWGEYAVIDTATTQNQLRWMLGVLCRMPTCRSGLGKTCYAANADDLHDFVVTQETQRKDLPRFRLWVSARNWKDRAAWYAGMIHAEKVRRNRNKKRKHVS